MKFGLNSKEYLFICENVVNPLEALGAKVWCFGSRARGNYQKFSDLDLAIETQNSVDIELSQIKELLENSNFPFKVDLVLKHQFAQSYLSGFEKDKILWSNDC